MILQQVQLTFVLFGVRRGGFGCGGPRCNCDYVLVYDGTSDSDTPLTNSKGLKSIISNKKHKYYVQYCQQ